MNIGLWIPHANSLCYGQFYTPTTLTRMHYNFTEQGGPKLASPCYNGFYIGNNVLGSFQGAQYSGTFSPGIAGLKLYLTLYVTGTYSFQPTVQVNGTTYLTTSGSVAVSLPFTTCTLNFSVNPVVPGSVPADGMQLTGNIAV